MPPWHTRTHTNNMGLWSKVYLVSTCPSAYTHALKNKTYLHTHTHRQLHMPDIPQDRSHKYMSHSNCPPLTTDQRLPSHTFRTHTLWLHHDSTDLWPEVKGVVVWWCGFILCVWSHFLPEWLWGAKGAILVDLKWGHSGGPDDTGHNSAEQHNIL